MASSTLAKKENQWAAYILLKLKYLPVYQTEPVRRENIEKCPEYFSNEMGGCVPIDSHLIDMFHFIIKQHQHYYDSECVKRAQSTKILTIYTSCKVPKWMII